MKWTVVVFFSLILWQIISGIAQNAAKKQQQQQMSDAARKRRESSAARQAAAPGTINRPDTTVAGPRSARLDDLAARRKAQLEELRRRRSAGETGGGRPPRPAQAKIGPAPGGPASRPKVPAMQQPPLVARPSAPKRGQEIQRVSADLRSAQEAHVRDRAEREERARQMRQQEAASQRRKEKSRQSDDRARAARRASESQEAAETAGAIAGRARRERISRYKRLLRNQRTLQDLFILREVLDPPVALRSNPGI